MGEYVKRGFLCVRVAQIVGKPIPSPTQEGTTTCLRMQHLLV
ncbi:hypothetical protein HBZS_105190 [Helicobacter bizzozeronii CCUG 35545]|nr:hypothetical protein HBZS_105190 [Helicobacter bizzozeronii CCUG 35545]